MQQLVLNNNNEPITTSRLVAEKFNKNHRDVLRAIEKMECSRDFHERNFALTSFEVAMPNGGVRMDNEYHITRDGFSFLVMGFTGKEAAKFKEDYINAFNKMAESIMKIQQSVIYKSQISFTKQQLIDAPAGEYNHDNFIGDYDEYDMDVHVRRFIKQNINRWLKMSFIPEVAFSNEYKTYCKLNGIAEPLKKVVVNHVLVNYCPKIGVKVNHAATVAGVKGKLFKL